MPRFYFDVREGARFVPDNEGLESDSLDAAEREAAEAAAQIGRDKLPKGALVTSPLRFVMNTASGC